MSAFLAVLLAASAAGNDDAPSFQREVLPVLRAHCAGCHQPARAEGGLDLTRHAAVIAGGASGPSVRPGDPEASLLLELVTPLEDLAAEMPPASSTAKPLDEAQRDLLRRWIAAGAPDDSSTIPPSFDVDNPPTYPQPPVVTALAFDPTGELLAVAGRNEVLLHAVSRSGGGPIRARLKSRLIGQSERIEGLAFSPDGNRLAAAGGVPGESGELQVWDVAERTLTTSVFVAGDCLHGASWSPDGSRVAFGCGDTSVRVVDADSGTETLYNAAHEDWVLGTEWSTDGSHLVTVSRDRSLKLFEVEDQQFIDNITSITPGALEGGLMAVARHPGADELLVGGADGTPKIYRMYREKKRVIGDDFNLLRALEPLPGRVFDVDWSRDGAHVVACASDRRGEVPGHVRLSAAADGATVWTRELPAGGYAVALHPSGELVAVAGYDGRVRLYETGDGTAAGSFPAAPQQRISR